VSRSRLGVKAGIGADSNPPQALPLFLIEQGVAPALRFKCLGTSIQPAAVVIHFVAALWVFFLNWFSLRAFSDDDDVRLGLAVRLEGSPLVAPRAVFQLDVFPESVFALSRKNLLANQY